MVFVIEANVRFFADCNVWHLDLLQTAVTLMMTSTLPFDGVQIRAGRRPCTAFIEIG
jgi:hypothetical protein